MYTKEQMLSNVIYRVLNNSSIDETLAVWNTVKSVCSQSAIKAALDEEDERNDGTVSEFVSNWVPNCKQRITEAERKLEQAREHLEQVRKDVKREELEASTNEKIWKELCKAL